MKIVRIEKDDLKNGDIVLSQAISCSDNRGGVSYKINSFENDYKYFLVLRDVKIEQEIEPKEDYENLLGSVWELLNRDYEIGGKATIISYSPGCFLAIDTKNGTYWETSRLSSRIDMIKWLKGKGAKRIK